MNESIGAFFSNLLVALAVSAFIAIIMLLFNGVICAYANMPVYLRWLYWICPTAYVSTSWLFGDVCESFVCMCVKPPNVICMVGVLLVFLKLALVHLVTKVYSVLDKQATSGYILSDYEDGNDGDLAFLDGFETPLRYHIGGICGFLVGWLVLWRVVCYLVLLFYQKEKR